MKLVSLLSLCFITYTTFPLTYSLIGHNLDLAHSGEGTVDYGDQSGMMVRRSIFESNVD